ncbi:MAG: hypothetical protein RIC15_10170 [Vicingaceae bacterium]
MTRYLFIALTKQRKLMMLRSEGKVLHRRMRKGYQVLLYQIDNFYIEVWYNLKNYRLENLVTHKDGSLLQFAFQKESAKTAA